MRLPHELFSHSYKWLLAHIGMSGVTHTQTMKRIASRRHVTPKTGSCSWKYVMSHISMSKVHEGVILKNDTNHVTYSCHTKEWVMFTWIHHVTRHVTHMNESYRAYCTHRQFTHECASSQKKKWVMSHTQEWVMSHVWMRHVVHIANTGSVPKGLIRHAFKKPRGKKKNSKPTLLRSWDEELDVSVDRERECVGGGGGKGSSPS